MNDVKLNKKLSKVFNHYYSNGFQCSRPLTNVTEAKTELFHHSTIIITCRPEFINVIKRLL